MVLNGEGGYREYCGRQYATKKSRGRQTREKKIARRQTPENKSIRPPIKWNTFKKVFPLYLSVTNKHANAKLVGVTKSLLGLVKKVPWGLGRGRL